jgi:hypothetical protein
METQFVPSKGGVSNASSSSEPVSNNCSYTPLHTPTLSQYQFNSETALLHNGGFCNGRIVKWFLHNSTNVLCNDLVLDCSMINESNEIFFCNFLKSISFIMEGKLISTKSVL